MSAAAIPTKKEMDLQLFDQIKAATASAIPCALSSSLKRLTKEECIIDTDSSQH